jgi:hypothetical protein
MQQASATACNWRSPGCSIRNPNTWWAATRLAWIWGLPRSPSFPVRARHAREVLCAELAPDAQAIRRLQRQMDRQRRANNPANYEERGRIKNRGKGRLSWKHSKRYLATRRRKATRERKLAAHRKSLHGRLVHEIVVVGNTILTEQLSYRARPQQFGRSVGLRAPGMFIAWLRRTVASTGGTQGARSYALNPTLKRSVMAAESLVSKPLWQRWHACPCGIGPIQRDLYSALTFRLSGCEQICSPRVPGTGGDFEGREPGLQAAYEYTIQRASARQHLPRCVTYPRSETRVCRKVQAE